MRLALALLLIAGAPQDEAALSPTAFRDRMAAAVRAVTGKPTTAVSDRSFRARLPDGTDTTVNVDNAYRQYQAEPAALAEILARNARLLTISDVANDKLDQLVVIVRPTDYLVRSLPPGASTDNFLPSRAMAGDLSYFLRSTCPRRSGPLRRPIWRDGTSPRPRHGPARRPT